MSSYLLHLNLKQCPNNQHNQLLCKFQQLRMLLIHFLIGEHLFLTSQRSQLCQYKYNNNINNNRLYNNNNQYNNRQMHLMIFWILHQLVNQIEASHLDLLHLLLHQLLGLFLSRIKMGHEQLCLLQIELRQHKTRF